MLDDATSHLSRHSPASLCFVQPVAEQSVCRLGITDDNIILMLADDTACNPRNAAPCQVFASSDHRLNLLNDTAQIDFKGPDVSVHNFMAALTGILPCVLLRLDYAASPTIDNLHPLGRRP